jgi:hypothetical protein
MKIFGKEISMEFLLWLIIGILGGGVGGFFIGQATAVKEIKQYVTQDVKVDQNVSVYNYNQNKASSVAISISGSGESLKGVIYTNITFGKYDGAKAFMSYLDFWQKPYAYIVPIFNYGTNWGYTTDVSYDVFFPMKQEQAIAVYTFISNHSTVTNFSGTNLIKW